MGRHGRRSTSPRVDVSLLQRRLAEIPKALRSVRHGWPPRIPLGRAEDIRTSVGPGTLTWPEDSLATENGEARLLREQHERALDAAVRGQQQAGEAVGVEALAWYTSFHDTVDGWGGAPHGQWNLVSGSAPRGGV